jgi:hypothetical protein
MDINKMTIQEVIQEIVTYHPCFESGMSRKWSHWNRGMMGGRGDWKYLDLIFAPENELRKCLEECRIENIGIDFRWNENYIRPELVQNG